MKKHHLYISEETLRDFAVMNKLWSDITLVPINQLTREDIEFETEIEWGISELREALINCLDSRMPAISFFLDWWEPFTGVFYNALELNTLLGDKISNLKNYKLADLPESNEDLLIWILNRIYSIYDDFKVADLQTPISEILKIDDLLDQIDFMEDLGLPYEERRYIDDLKLDYVIAHDNNLILMDADKDTRNLFRLFTDELADNGNLEAIRIKGYACYGGNSVYECDWETAAECMDILWRDGGFGYAANSLGYIYYEGKLNNDIPDYEKAFFYYSIGQTFGINESSCKIADMFLYGQYVKPNFKIAKSIIERLYGETRFNFEHGEFDGTFPEVAHRMGKLLLMDKDPISKGLNMYPAYRFFLQAEFALILRMQEGSSMSDRKLMEEIRKYKAETDYADRHFKKSTTIDNPVPLYELIGNHSYCIYKLTIKGLKNSRLKMSVVRLQEGNDDYVTHTLITYPEFACCDLANEVTLIANEAKFSYLGDGEPKQFYFDSIDFKRTNEGEFHRFLLNGEVIFMINAKNYTVKRPRL